MPSILASSSSWALLRAYDFPIAAVALRSGSKVLVNERLKVLRPAKPDNTTNKAPDPITMTRKVIKLMIFTAFWLLLDLRYLFAMYAGKFNQEG